eukprot:3029359-Alexandrium_andersonii.AAC.1
MRAPESSEALRGAQDSSWNALESSREIRRAPDRSRELLKFRRAQESVGELRNSQSSAELRRAPESSR